LRSGPFAIQLGRDDVVDHEAAILREDAFDDQSQDGRLDGDARILPPLPPQHSHSYRCGAPRVELAVRQGPPHQRTMP